MQWAVKAPCPPRHLTPVLTSTGSCPEASSRGGPGSAPTMAPTAVCGDDLVVPNSPPRPEDRPMLTTASPRPRTLGYTFLTSALLGLLAGSAPACGGGGDGGDGGSGGECVGGKVCTCDDATCDVACPGNGSGCSFTCDPGQSCSFHCPGSGCAFECSAGADCTTSCAGGGCSLKCHDGATCTGSCAGGGCGMTCDGAASCTSDCSGNSCSLACDATDVCEEVGCDVGCGVVCGGAGTCTSSCTVLGGGCSLTP